MTSFLCMWIDSGSNLYKGEVMLEMTSTVD